METVSVRVRSENCCYPVIKKGFRYLDDESVVARHSREVPSPQARDPGVSATSPDYYVDVDGDAN